MSLGLRDGAIGDRDHKAACVEKLRRIDGTCMAGEDFTLLKRATEVYPPKVKGLPVAAGLVRLWEHPERACGNGSKRNFLRTLF